MANKTEAMVSASILSRLSNENTDVIRFDGISVEQLCDDIKMNLQALLNTRSWQLLDLDHEQQSVINYGLADFSHDYFDKQTVAKKICVTIADLIEKYEPRLTDIAVSLTDQNYWQRLLSIRIDALVQTQPAQAAIFESKMDLLQQRIRFS